MNISLIDFYLTWIVTDNLTVNKSCKRKKTNFPVDMLSEKTNSLIAIY